VTVFHCIEDEGRPQYEVEKAEDDDLSIIRVVRNHRFPTFRHTYIDEKMEDIFRQVLDETRPEIVHIQHLLLHSVRYPTIARERNVKVAMTLAEFLLLCPRNGWLLRPGNVRCDGPDAKQCGRCTLVWPHPTGGILPRRVQRMLGKIKLRLGIHDGSYVKANRKRREEVQAALADVNLFIAPSRFLRDRFVQNGLVPAEKIVHSDYGFLKGRLLSARAKRKKRTESIPLRIGFTGTVSDWKGVHVLVEAMNGIPEGAVTCDIHGSLDSFPAYAERLKKLSRNPSVQFRGRFDNSRVADVLAEMDVLVVPSLWYENSPLTIHEAFVAGMPVITGNEGGMAELIQDGTWGLLFRIGDAADLRQKILRLVEEPGLLDRLRKGIPQVKDIDDDARETEDRFAALVAGRLPPR
jgi:glycosyltransferase involved in cell wall biosynthesis